MRMNARTAGTLGIVCGVAIAAALGWWLLRGDEPAETPESAPTPTPAPVSEAPAPEPAESEGGQTAAAPAAPAEAAPEAEAEPEPAPQAEPGPAATGMAEGEAPALDIIRIEPDGAGLVAGRAAPGAEVEILVDDKVVGAATAAPDGGFVAMIETTPESETAQRVVARVRPAPETAPAADQPEAAGAAETAPAAEPQVAAAAPAPEAAETSDPAFIIGADDASAAPLIVRPEADGVSVLQGPHRGPAAAVALDTITYDSEGHVVLRGRAPEGADVRVYLDQRAAGDVTAGADGLWTFRPGGEFGPGDYTLRLDQIDAGGGVESRIETPFRREAIAPGAAPASAMVVQRGDSLWRIAENVYGEGLRYTLIYEANNAAIRDPDLIYPGQIFELPEPAGD